MSTITVTPFDELKKLQAQHDECLAAAESYVRKAEERKSGLSTWEQQKVNDKMREANELKPRIAAAKAKAVPSSRNPEEVRLQLAKHDRRLAPSALRQEQAESLVPTRFSRDYYDAFYARLGSGGPINAALYEGSTSGGGYAVPIIVDNFIAPLAPTASDIRSIATVIPTTKNLLLPTTAPTGLPSTTQTAELSAFAQSVPSLGQVQLQAYLNALLAPVSLELTEDAPGLETWMRTVVEAALLEQEDALFVSGTGSNQPQGVIGNCGAGITAEPDGNGNAVSFAGLSALMGAVKAKYLSNASWLMSQSTALVVRAALAYSGASFEWTRGVDGVERLFGYRVAYSASMPTAARGNAPVVFGNWKMGYAIADRGGPAVRLKILDQMFGTNGTLYWLLSRRTDAQVWVQEALQQYTVASS
jgi:HK97 family phage major capsid protein